MDKDVKISDDLKHFIENGICHTKEGYTTKILLYEKSENIITQCSLEKNKKGIDNLYKVKSFVNKSKPDIKAVLIIFPYSEIFEE